MNVGLGDADQLGGRIGAVALAGGSWASAGKPAQIAANTIPRLAKLMGWLLLSAQGSNGGGSHNGAAE